MTNEDVLRAVLKAWGEGIEAAQKAMRAHLTDDCPWEQMGLPTTTGGEEAAQLFGSMEATGFSAMAVEYRNVAVVGVTEFRDGKISAWREYFDSRNLEMLPTD